MVTHLSSVSAPRLKKTSSGIPNFPKSCRSAPRRRWAISVSLYRVSKSGTDQGSKLRNTPSASTVWRLPEASARADGAAVLAQTPFARQRTSIGPAIQSTDGLQIVHRGPFLHVLLSRPIYPTHTLLIVVAGARFPPTPPAFSLNCPSRLRPRFQSQQFRTRCRGRAPPPATHRPPPPGQQATVHPSRSPLAPPPPQQGPGGGGRTPPSHNPH